MKITATEKMERINQKRTTEKNLETVVEVYKATRDTDPENTAAELVKRMGYAVAVEAVAELVNSVGKWDGRIFPSVRAWAAEQPTAATRDELDNMSIYQPSDIHPAHINQIGEAMRDYEPEEEPAEMVSVSDLAADLDTGDHGDRLNDYRDSSAYICDAIAEIADNDTSIYYSDILDFIRENPEALADVIDEGLYDPSHDYDLYKHGQAAEYMTIENDIYKHLADSLMLAALDFIRYDLNRETIPADLAESLREWCDNADNNDRMDEIPDLIRDYFADDDETED